VKNFSHLIGALIWLSAAVGLEAQIHTGKIEGTVLHQSQPVEFLHVAIPGTHYGAMTDSNGHYTIANVPTGRYTLQFSAVGYQSVKTEVEVTTGRTTIITTSVDEDIAQLDEIVVTGTMKEVSTMDSPIPVEVYSPAFFRKNPSPNIFESLSMINGVQPQINCNVCNTGDIHINGLEGPYTMILIDGMPIVSSLSSVYGLAGIPNNMVKRIEVAKGPASTLYGSEAVGGVVNIITKNPISAPRLSIDAFATSVGEYSFDLSSGFKMKKAHGLLGLNYFNYTDRRDINQDNFIDVTLQDRISIFNKWNLERPSGKNASVAARYIYENRYGGEMQWTHDFRGSDIYYGESIFTNRVELIGNYEFGNIPNLNFDYSYNYHHQDSYYGLVEYIARQHVGFTQLRWMAEKGKHSLLVGTPLRYTFYDDNTPGTSDIESNNQPDITLLPGIFVQDEIQLSRQLTTLIGARYDHHNVHGSIFTPRLSFKYSPNVNSTLRLTSGSGFRVVNLFTEEHAALTGSRNVILRNDLNPEQSWNINLNYARTQLLPNGFFNFDISLFYTYFNNKIIGDFISDPDAIIYDNLQGYAVSQGLTVNTDLMLNNGFKLISGITLQEVYSRNQLEGPDKIPQVHAPVFSGTITASYPLERLGLNFDINARINGPMYLPVAPNDFRPDQSPWFAIVNLQATKKIQSNFEVYGGVKNLLNFIPKDPLLRPFDPFDKSVSENNPNGYTFDTSYNYAPIQGTKVFFGLRYTIN